MPVNALTTEVGLRVGPVVFGTLFKHYLDRRKKSDTELKIPTPLQDSELLYHEIFNIVKEFLRIASYHTVEDVQRFANTRTPSPPWVHVVRLIIPISSCDEAAQYLIKALGGEDAARRIVGGVKWWQVRGLDGVDAQWITAKRDWREAKRRYKMQEQSKESISPPSSETDPTDSGKYEKDMDEMRCILYSHGGGYYFGSVEQHRYSIQRHARKLNGRVLAVNYRLAPQYPFPCALHDLLAAYLFLIRPPPGSAHRPVDPKHIVIAGDSAGGGLSLALLQVIRDSGLPQPAGGVLISPWCDATHSFPSTHTNTATDIIPAWGLSFQKPSVLWPPPSDDISRQVHASLRSRLRQALQMKESRNVTEEMLAGAYTLDGGQATPLPVPKPKHEQNISFVASSGEVLSTDQQLHLYTQNRLLSHPLVSPVLSYLGGLPPLLVIAGEEEVLRDEIIYLAHKAAYPDQYPVKDEARALYPALNGIEDRNFEPTKVHLQVYDGTPHIFPVLFSFTSPAKFCYRAIATFCKFVTGLAPTPSSPIITSAPNLRSTSSFRAFKSKSKSNGNQPFNDCEPDTLVSSNHADSKEDKATSSVPKGSLKRSVSETLNRATSKLRKGAQEPRAHILHESSIALQPPLHSGASSTANGSRSRSKSLTPGEAEPCTAGHPSVYGELVGQPWDGKMVRERISTQGVIRPLEPISALTAFEVPPENIGQLSEFTIRRFLDNQIIFNKRFSRTIDKIEEERLRHLKLARKDTQKNMARLQQSLLRENGGSPKEGVQEGLAGLSGHWAWILDEGENPPPSSIVSRRDTSEARRLARVADQAALQEDQMFSGNRLWAAIENFLTAAPEAAPSPPDISPPKSRPSKFSRIFRSDTSIPTAVKSA